LTKWRIFNAVPFPIPPGYSNFPVWTGKGFQVGSANLQVLQYTECNTGWNSYLTEFHEVEANHGNHYIDRASRIHAISELRKNLHEEGVILEIGSSSGYLLQDIKKHSQEYFSSDPTVFLNL